MNRITEKMARKDILFIASILVVIGSFACINFTFIDNAYFLCLLLSFIKLIKI